MMERLVSLQRLVALHQCRDDGPPTGAPTYPTLHPTDRSRHHEPPDRSSGPDSTPTAGGPQGRPDSMGTPDTPGGRGVQLGASHRQCNWGGLDASQRGLWTAEGAADSRGGGGCPSVQWAALSGPEVGGDGRCGGGGPDCPRFHAAFLGGQGPDGRGQGGATGERGVVPARRQKLGVVGNEGHGGRRSSVKPVATSPAGQRPQPQSKAKVKRSKRQRGKPTAANHPTTSGHGGNGAAAGPPAEMSQGAGALALGRGGKGGLEGAG